MESSPRISAQTPSPTSLSLSNSDPPITRSEPSSPYPTTFVQADTTSFKKVVQLLTGSPETVTRRQDPTRNPNPIPAVKPGPIRKDHHQHKSSSASKLYERRNSFKNFKMISPMGHARPLGWIRPGRTEVLSPSLLDFPSLVLSPVTPLIPDPFRRAVDAAEEEKAIKEKGFYLHPSPKDSEPPPTLLPLFPLTSPRAVKEGSSSSSSAGN